MVRLATDDEMVSIRILLSRGFVVTGHGYRYSLVNDWLTVEPVD